jgi:hypothetical protein
VTDDRETDILECELPPWSDALRRIVLLLLLTGSSLKLSDSHLIALIRALGLDGQKPVGSLMARRQSGLSPSSYAAGRAKLAAEARNDSTLRRLQGLSDQETCLAALTKEHLAAARATLAFDEALTSSLEREMSKLSRGGWALTAALVMLAGGLASLLLLPRVFSAGPIESAAIAVCSGLIVSSFGLALLAARRFLDDRRAGGVPPDPRRTFYLARRLLFWLPGSLTIQTLVLSRLRRAGMSDALSQLNAALCPAPTVYTSETARLEAFSAGFRNLCETLVWQGRLTEPHVFLNALRGLYDACGLDDVDRTITIPGGLLERCHNDPCAPTPAQDRTTGLGPSICRSGGLGGPGELQLVSGVDDLLLVNVPLRGEDPEILSLRLAPEPVRVRNPRAFCLATLTQSQYMDVMSRLPF